MTAGRSLGKMAQGGGRSRKRSAYKGRSSMGSRPMAVQLRSVDGALGGSTARVKMTVSGTANLATPSAFGGNSYISVPFYTNWMNTQFKGHDGLTGSHNYNAKHQPRGFLTMSERYSAYQVLGAKIQVWCTIATDSNDGVNDHAVADPYQVAWIPNTDRSSASHDNTPDTLAPFSVFETMGTRIAGLQKASYRPSKTASTYTNSNLNVFRTAATLNGGGMENVKKYTINVNNKALAPQAILESQKVTTMTEVDADITRPLGVDLMFVSTAALSNSASNTMTHHLHMHYVIDYDVVWSGRKPVAKTDITTGS